MKRGDSTQDVPRHFGDALGAYLSEREKEKDLCLIISRNVPCAVPVLFIKIGGNLIIISHVSSEMGGRLKFILCQCSKSCFYLT